MWQLFIVFFISTSGTSLVNKIHFQHLTLVGPTVTRPVSDLVVISLDNWLYMWFWNSQSPINYFYLSSYSRDVPIIQAAAVSCSPVTYLLGGVGFVSRTTGKLGRAWHGCMGGAWHRCTVLVGWEGAWLIYWTCDVINGGLLHEMDLSLPYHKGRTTAWQWYSGKKPEYPE